MPTRIELLKRAGFSDGEIGDWATAERQRMQQAGFTDSEIDDEFGVTRPPTEVPPAFIERLKQGNVLQRVLGAAGEYAQRYFGDEPLGFSPANKEALSKLGILGDIVVPAAKPVDALLRSIPAGIAGVGAGLGQIVEEGHDATLGPGPYAKGKAARDFAQLAGVAALLSGAKGAKIGSVRTPAPSVGNGAVIALPRAEDFRAAAASISGSPASFSTEQKLLRLWTEHGIPPTEVAEDALRDQTIADAIRSASEKLPEAYVRNNATTAATGASPSRQAQIIEPAQNDSTAVPAERGAAPMEAEAKSSANPSASEPARMIAKSEDDFMFDPPRKLQRPFASDYDYVPRVDEQGRLLQDIERRPLEAQFVVGRRFHGQPDEPLSPEDLKKAMQQLDIRFAEVPRKQLLAETAGMFIGSDKRRRPVGDIFVSSEHTPADRNLLAAHEFGHAIDHFTGLLTRRLSQNEFKELRGVYHALRSGYEQQPHVFQPELFGYLGDVAKFELVAEGIRAYMADPNYFKTVAPLTAAKIREAVNENPYLKKVIQFNSLAAAGLIGSGIRNQAESDE